MSRLSALGVPITKRTPFTGFISAISKCATTVTLFVSDSRLGIKPFKNTKSLENSMIKTISTALAAFAAVTFAGLSGEASAQGCSSCSPAPQMHNFAYPAASAGCGQAGCQSGHGHGVHGRIKEHYHELKQQFAFTSANNEKIAARNDAWPLPFTCWDKRGYYSTWSPMLQAGSEISAVLDSNFFSNSNELNRVGIDRVAGIVQNMPSNERTLYVTRSGDDFTNRARVEAIKNTLSTYYASSGPVDVRLSNRIPETVAGSTIVNNREVRNNNLPPAIIPVASGGSVDEAVTE